MNCLKRNLGNIHQVHVPVDPPVQTKVAEIGRNSIGIGGVVAADSDGSAILSVGIRQSSERFGNVEVKFVVAAFMRSDQKGADPEGGRLTRTLEVQDRSPLGIGITHIKPRSVPSLSTKIRLVGVARVAGVEAMGKNGGLPRARLIRLPNIIDVADRAGMEFPPRVHSLDANWDFFIFGPWLHGRSTQWSGE